MAAPHYTPSEHDLELLSAYLDGELPDREREALEQRLDRDAELRSTLDELRTTLAMLHDLPRLKAPRDFTLDPVDYQRPTPWWQRLLTLEVAFQVTGTLGAVASVAVIVLALALGSTTDDTPRQSAVSDDASVALQPSPLPSRDYTATAEAARTAIAYSGEDLIQTTIVAQSTFYAATPDVLSTPSPDMPEAASEMAEEAMEAPAPRGESAEGVAEEQQTFAANGPQVQTQSAADDAAALTGPTAPDAGQAPAGDLAPPPAANVPEEAPGPTALEFEEREASDAEEAGGADTAAGTLADGDELEADAAAANALGATGAAAGALTSTPTPAAIAEIPTAQPEPDEPLVTAPQPEAEEETAGISWLLVGIGLGGFVVSITLIITGRRKAKRV